MDNQQQPLWKIAAVTLILAMTSLACGLTVDAPDFNQVRPTEQFSRPPADEQVEPGVPQTGPENEQTAVIPETERVEPGNLAEPVSDPPENLEELYERTNPGTVSILTQSSQGGIIGGGAGSGFILTDNGYIATNHHVVQDASTIIVRFYNDADIVAQVVGSDPNTDLAILKVNQMAEGAVPLPLGDSNQVRVGDSVVAIGNPFSLGTSMSAGIISAVSRTIPSGFTPYNIPQAIQTDAAINPGNSGGPLINMNGEVIGINAQIRTAGQGGGNIGIGFAIPVNILKLIYPALIEQGFYTWPYLGVSSPVDTPLSVEAGDLQAQRGALIASVEPGGPSDQAGIREGDVVIEAGDTPIHSFDDLLTYIAYLQPGQTITLTVVRNGEQIDLPVTLGERPRQQAPGQ